MLDCIYNTGMQRPILLCNQFITFCELYSALLCYIRMYSLLCILIMGLRPIFITICAFTRNRNHHSIIGLLFHRMVIFIIIILFIICTMYMIYFICIAQFVHQGIYVHQDTLSYVSYAGHICSIHLHI